MAGKFVCTNVWSVRFSGANHQFFYAARADCCPNMCAVTMAGILFGFIRFVVGATSGGGVWAGNVFAEIRCIGQLKPDIYAIDFKYGI